ncbi:MAG: PhzF family phenazine biosynthesis protein, partial [Bacteroidetes bacterium]|nr:PhzF family phenazine biosynthesis protein [Fibrella sp.]
DAQMGQMAREINFPETTFITGGSPETGFDVRIFTPEYEVPFAGHPTLGTAWVLTNQLLKFPGTSVTLNLKIGPIRVETLGDTLWLTAAQPHFGQTFSPAHVAELLHIPENAIDEDYPIEWVSTGLPDVIVPLRALEGIRAVRLEAESCKNWLLRHHLHRTNSLDQLTTSFYVFCPETYSPANHLNARMFCLENSAITEDPATGSAASCLLAYLLKNKFGGQASIRLRVEQGYERHRPSLLELDGTIRPDGKYTLRIGGQVQFVARGEWTV